MGDQEDPEHPGEVHTPEMNEEEQFEDAPNNDEDNEVILNPRQIDHPDARRALFRGHPPMNDGGDERNLAGAAAGAIGGAPHPWIRLAPDTYDGTGDWEEYSVYFHQLSLVNGWDEPTQAIMLGLNLRGQARAVLTGLSVQERQHLPSIERALQQNFSPTQQQHTYLSKLRSRKRKANEPLPELGREIARLVRLAYPRADPATREQIAINAFSDSFPGPAIEVRLHIIRGQPQNLQEAIALAMEVDSVLEHSKSQTVTRRGVQMVTGSPEEDQEEELTSSQAQLKAMAEALASLENKIKTLEKSQKKTMKSKKDIKCFNCGKKGHFQRECRAPKKPKDQGNEQGRADPQ